MSRKTTLKLTRSPGQVLLIGDDISVTIAGVDGKKVSVWITAPEEVAILRNEARVREKTKPTHAA